MLKKGSTLRKTLSLCPECGADAITAVTRGESPEILRHHAGIIEAEIVESDNQVFIRKRCSRHGEFVDLIATDAAFHNRMESLAVAPEREYHADEPLDDYGPMSVQYGTGAFLILDLTNRCNMKCEPCFMDANSGKDVHELTLNDIKSILIRAASVPNRREVNLLLSGGEPTLSRHFLETLNYARQLGFRRLYVATNGIRFALEPHFAEEAKRAGLQGVFLQIDGTTDRSNAHRGIENFMDVKNAALGHMSDAGLQVILQTAVMNGLNNDQVGPLVQFAIERKLFGVVFQPIMFAGRDRSVSTEIRRARRYTLSNLASDLAEQVTWDWRPLRDWFPASTFSMMGYLADRLYGCQTSLVCTATSTSAVGSPLVVNIRTGVVVPLASFFDVPGFIDDVRQMIDQDLDGFRLIAQLQAAIDSRFHPACAPRDFSSSDLYRIHEQFMARVNSSIEGWAERRYESGEWRLFIVLGIWFQDLFNFDLRAIQASTIIVATNDGETSFCAYNAAGWREAVERIHRTATLSEWHRSSGRQAIFSGGKLVTIGALVESKS